jgi:glutamate-ammonia-ligase adenylyltransferase
VSIDEFRQSFAQAAAPLQQRLALCKARVIFAAPSVAQRAMQAITEAAYGPEWKPGCAEQIRHLRLSLQSSASERNIKRRPGGTMDVEMLVQALQLQHGREQPSIRLPGTLQALKALCEAGILGADDYALLDQSYRFLRSVEARIRLMNATARHDLPQDPTELGKLAYLLGYAQSSQLVAETQAFCAENRRRFEQLLKDSSRKAAKTQRSRGI